MNDSADTYVTTTQLEQQSQNQTQAKQRHVSDNKGTPQSHPGQLAQHVQKKNTSTLSWTQQKKTQHETDEPPDNLRLRSKQKRS